MVVTEAGFAFELGAEKFFDINCRYGGFAPSCTVLVATVRALKMHGGVPLAQTSATPDAAAVARGLENLDKHIENIRKFEQPCVVAINHFPTDTDEEIASCARHCEALGIAAVVARPFSRRRRRLPRAGGASCGRSSSGDAAALPAALRLERADRAEDPHHRARDVRRRGGRLHAARQARPRRSSRSSGFGGLPVCIAKTQQSLSDNPALLGRPKDFLVTVREIQLAAGAGFVVPITGEILRMPGLPREPLAERFDLSDDGEIVMRA